MSPLDLPGVGHAAAVIDLVGSLFVAGYACAAVAALVRGRGVLAARLLLADGAVTGLSFKTAAALLKTVELHTWEQFGLFSAVLAARILLKQLFRWEEQRLARRPGGDAARPGAPP